MRIQPPSPHPWQVLSPKSLLPSSRMAVQSLGAQSPTTALVPTGLGIAACRAQDCCPQGSGLLPTGRQPQQQCASAPRELASPGGRVGIPRAKLHWGRGGGSPVPLAFSPCHWHFSQAMPGLGQFGAQNPPHSRQQAPRSGRAACTMLPSAPRRDSTWEAVGLARGSKIRSFLSCRDKKKTEEG